MPVPQSHIVARCGMEIEFQDGRMARSATEEIMAACRASIEEVLQACFDELVGPETYVSLDRLEIDLGQLNPHQVAEDFMAKLRGRITEAVTISLAEESKVDPAARALEMVQQYGHTGQYPWWAGSPTPALLTRAMDTLLAPPQRHLHVTLRDLLRQGQTLRRLIFGLPAPQMQALHSALERLQPPLPAEAAIGPVTAHILAAHSRLEQNRWRTFAFRAMHRAIAARPEPLHPQDILVWFQIQGVDALPPALGERMQHADDAVALVQWFRNTLDTPAQLLADVLLAHDSAHATLRQWLQVEWGLGTTTAAQLVQHLAHGWAQAPVQRTNSPAAPIPSVNDWLAKALDDPSATLPELLVKLGRKIAKATADTPPNAMSLHGWLSKRYSLPSHLGEKLVAALLPIVHAQWQALQPTPLHDWDSLIPQLCAILNLNAATVTRGLVLEALAAKYRDSSPDSEEPPHAGAWQEWLRSTLGLPMAGAAPLARDLSEAWPRLSVQVPAPVAEERIAPTPEELATLAPALRDALGMAHAPIGALMNALLSRYLEGAPQGTPTLDGLSAWLRGQVTLLADARRLLAAGMLAHLPSAPAPASQPRTMGLDEVLPAIREAIADPTATTEALMDRLLMRYLGESGTDKPTEKALMDWLMAALQISEAQAKVVARALLGIWPSATAKGAVVEAVGWEAAMDAFRAALETPSATEAEVMELLVRQYLESRRLPAATPSLAEWAGWLRSLVDVEQLVALVAEQLLAMVIAEWVEGEERTDYGVQEPLLVRLRKALEWPTGSWEELLGRLVQAYLAGAEGVATAEAVAQWLADVSRDWQMAESERTALAASLLARLPRRLGAGGKPFSHVAIAPMLPMLRRKLGLPAADAAAVLKALWHHVLDQAPSIEPTVSILSDALGRLGYHKDQRRALAQEMIAAGRPKGELPVEEESPEPLPLRTWQAPSELPYYVENAGLIIFWPFFERFLQFQELVVEKEFVSVMAQEQAVRLLQSLVTPDEEWNEAALALPKVLCGLSPDAIVDPTVEVPEDQLEAVQQLIDVALAHWTLAGNMSSEGFRRAWLQRTATLRIRDDHWLLRVETQAHDIILEGLPWEIAYVQLPWMRHVLYVDWGEKAKFNS